MPVRKLHVTAHFKNSSVVEDFIRKSTFIAESKKESAVIIGTEIFDNIVEHAKLLMHTGIEVVVSDIDCVTLQFRYRSTNFAQLRNSVDVIKPHFDKNAKRYRGFGLRMAGNLAQKIRYRDCFCYSRIIAYL